MNTQGRLSTRIAIGSDHVGYSLKEEIKKYLAELGYVCQDFGASSEDRTDYPLFAKEVTAAISSGQADLGILICGTGVGMSIAANKVKGMRAVVCSEPYSAMLSRQHNNTNVLALGARVIGSEVARMIVKAWLDVEFEGGRHASRVDMISQIEAERSADLHADGATQKAPAQPDLISQTRIKIAETGKLVFERHLTDAAGGNISVRVDDRVCITPRYSGSKRHWQLKPNQVLVSDLSGNQLDGDGEISREGKVHLRLYQAFPDATAVLHSHARNVMVFVASGQPIEPILEATLKFGTIPVAPRFAPAHSEKLADVIVEAVTGKDEAIRKYATAVIAPWHGLFVVGKDLEAAFDLTERIDTNAYCILMSRLLPEGGPLDPETIQSRLKDTRSNLSMIVTLTPNTAIDYTLQVESFQLGTTIRAVGSAWGMGGKAADASWILGKLGVPSRALGFAAGLNGQRMESMLRERGVETDFVWVDGETRLNSVIAISGEGHSTITSSSLRVSSEDLSALSVRYQKALEGASCIVTGGSLPRDVPIEFFAQAVAQAHERGIPVIFDSSGPALAAGLKSCPALIKPNLAELSHWLGFMPTSRPEVEQAARNLHDEYGTDVIVTLGAEGAFAVSGEGAYFIHPVPTSVVSAAGAGDGVLAGMALAYSRGESFEQGLRCGFALAGAILKTLATADFRMEEFQELLPQIRITVL